MYWIKVKGNFSSAHNLRNYHGKCEHLHGHNWALEVEFEFKKLDKDGMALDFREAKAMLKRAVEDMDHSYLNELKDFKKANPTSENIAKLIYDRIKKESGHIKSVSVWENDSSCATYTADSRAR